MKSLFLVATLFLGSFLAASRANAQFGPTYSITNTNDSGPGSLRQAIIDYNGFSSGQFQFQLSSPFPYINLQSPLPVLNNYPRVSNTTTISLTIAAGNRTVALSDGIAVYDYAQYGGPLTLLTLNQVVSITYQNFSPKAFVVTTTDLNPVAGSLTKLLAQAEARIVTPYDSIVFNIPGAAPHVFSPTSIITVKSPVIIDGTTQPSNGYTGISPKIEFSGNSTNSAFYFNGGNQYTTGPNFYARGSEIHGLYIHGFGTAIFYDYMIGFIIGKPGKGNVLSGNGVGVGSDYYDGNSITIQNNIIGLDPSGAVAMPNTAGIRLSGQRISILNNIISGNTQEAIGIVQNTSPNTLDNSNMIIKGNKIGTTPDGMTAIPNGKGLYLKNVNGITIGGPGNDRNIISGNNGDAIALYAISYNYMYPTTSLSNVKITNNYIGTAIDGLTSLGNKGNGVSIAADTITAVIGGNTLSEGNIIANNKFGITYTRGIQIRNNSIFDNGIGIKQGVIPTPVITFRSNTMLQGTALPQSIVQLYEDDGFNSSPQGKKFLAEINADAAGQWSYAGAIQNPCQTTAICIQPNYSRSSAFSLSTHPDLIPDTLIFCNGDQATVKAAAGFASYNWNTGFSGQTFTTTTAGKYWVNVDNGCNYSDTVQIIFTTRPTVALGNDTTYCDFKYYTLNTAQVTNATYTWTFNNSLTSEKKSSYAVFQSGKYSVQTSIGQCKASDTIQVTLLPTPNIRTLSTVSKCPGAAYTITKPATNQYLWSDGSTGNALTVTQPGVYKVVATSSQGCSGLISRDSITVIDVIMPLDLGRDTSVCGTAAVIKDLSASGATSYQWYRKAVGASSYSSVSTSSSFSISQNGSYVASLTKGVCTKKDTLEVVFFPMPKAGLGNDTIVCGPITLSSRQNFSGALYTWSNGSNSNTLPVTLSGTYSLEIKYNETCFSRDIIHIAIVNCNAFHGIIYLDNNNSGVYEPSDSVVNGSLVEARSQTGLAYYSMTQHDGSYHFELPSGIYTVKTNIAAANITVPAAKYYTIDAGHTATQTSYDFIVNLPSNELSISMASPFNVRLGTDFKTTITLQNTGKNSQRGLVTLSKDPFIVYIESSVPLISSNNSMLFDAGYILPGQTATFTVTWITPINTTLTGKRVLLTSSIPTDDYAGNNNALNLITCGYPVDPNHKYVVPQYDPAVQQPANSKRLQYVIEFQNTGTDTAYQVVIADTLSKKLNPLTFQPGPASAPYSWTMNDGGIVTFTFANINLPDSNVNQKASNGFVSFTIDHLLTQATDSLYNEASIFFDLANPVVTNKAYYKLPGSQSGQNVFVNALTGLKYGQGYAIIQSGASSGLPVAYAYDGPAEIRGDTLYIIGAGGVRLEVFQNGNNQFSWATPKYQYFEIGRGDQVIYFTEISDKQTTDQPFNLEAHGGNSGNAIVFEVLRGPAVIDRNVVTLTGSGEVEIAATQAGNTLYQPAVNVTRIFNVSVVTAAEENNVSYLSVGPNPFSEYVVINGDNKTQSGSYSIYDLQGALIQAGEYEYGQRLDTSYLTRGSYILKLFKGEQLVLIEKIIRQ